MVVAYVAKPAQVAWPGWCLRAGVPSAAHTPALGLVSFVRACGSLRPDRRAVVGDLDRQLDVKLGDGRDTIHEVRYHAP